MQVNYERQEVFVFVDFNIADRSGTFFRAERFSGPNYLVSSWNRLVNNYSNRYFVVHESS